MALAPARAADEFLDPEVAFKGSARAVDDRTVEVSFQVAPGYYLYREQFKFAAEGATLGTPSYPAGKVKFDETFQKNVETHRDLLRIPVPVQQAGGSFRLAVNYQGCADKGLCYPPMQMRADVSLVGFGGSGSVKILPGRDMPIADGTPGASPAAGGVGINTASAADSAGIEAALRGGGFWTIVGVFFLAGIVLSFTPCVLPMVPILSSIIVGQGASDVARDKRARGFALALSYSLGMALVYTALGVAAGLAGEGLAATLQNPWVLGAFALALVLLSLSMFGVYELQLPAAVTGPLTGVSQRLPGGRFAGVFAMGGVSALIVSPCVAAPLAAALVFLSQTRDVALGGSALFSLAAGMSVPLLLVGASAGALLPKAGAWMNDVKHVFGVLLIAVAVWTIQPVLPASLALALWGALLVGSAVALYAGGRAGGWARKAVAAVLAVFGVLQLIGAASGGTDPLQPLAHLGGNSGPASERALPFALVRSTAELDAALKTAQQSGRPVMLDFYADWCVSCKEMERFTFSEPAVRDKLAGAVLLKADVTKNNADDRELLKRFQLFGPPGTIFFDAQGREVTASRLVGYEKASRFVERLRSVGL
ncbi:MAG TPA: protein-disulfide reductase DsbD [Albitalea sp.]|uniref:protein-disulfide reductase DsbD n=1 Tax=Piscinibacter sp. TaxID=1903157 RepID=UPI002ED1C136